MHLIEVEVHPGERLPVTRQMAARLGLVQPVDPGPGTDRELWSFTDELQASFYCQLILTRQLLDRPLVIDVPDTEVEAYLAETKEINDLASNILLRG